MISEEELNELIEKSRNRELEDELTRSKEIIDGLAAYCDSRSYTESRNAYHSFADNYFENYKKTIEAYVAFLRNNVAEGYEKTEQDNTDLASAFK